MPSSVAISGSTISSPGSKARQAAVVRYSFWTMLRKAPEGSLAMKVEVSSRRAGRYLLPSLTAKKFRLDARERCPAP